MKIRKIRTRNFGVGYFFGVLIVAIIFYFKSYSSFGFVRFLLLLNVIETPVWVCFLIFIFGNWGRFRRFRR